MSERLGERILFENERVRIWDHPIRAGSREECHTHRNPYVAIVVQGGVAEVTGEEGEVVQQMDVADGEALYFGPEVLPITHGVWNAGDEDIRMILVEFL